MNITIQSKN